MKGNHITNGIYQRHCQQLIKSCRQVALNDNNCGYTGLRASLKMGQLAISTIFPEKEGPWRYLPFSRLPFFSSVQIFCRDRYRVVGYIAKSLATTTFVLRTIRGYWERWVEVFERGKKESSKILLRRFETTKGEFALVQQRLTLLNLFSNRWTRRPISNLFFSPFMGSAMKETANFKEKWFFQAIRNSIVFWILPFS